MQDHYSYPSGFKYDDVNFSDEPFESDPSLSTYNAPEKSLQLYNYVKHMAEHYQGTHMFIPWGDDFTYGNAHLTFAPVDQLIAYFNANHDDMTLLYSTPSQYLDSIKA